MSRRNLLTILFLLALLLASLWFFTRRSVSHGFGDPYKPIPTDACLILESPDLPGFLNRLSGRPGLFRELLEVKELSSFKAAFTFADTTFSNKDIKKLFGFGNAVISFHVVGKGRLVPLLSVNVTPELKLRHLKELLQQAGALQMKESEYQGSSLLEIPWTRNGSTEYMCVAYRTGSLLLSTSRVLVETAVRHSEEEDDIRSDNTFTRVYRAAGQNEDRLFVIFRNLPGFLSSFTTGKGKALAGASARVAGSAEGDILIRENGLTVSGYIESTDPDHTLYRLKGVPVFTFDSYKVLPSVTALYESFALQTFGKKGQVVKGSQQVHELLASQIIPFLGDEVTMAIIDIRERAVDNNRIVIYEIRNREHINNVIDNVLRERGGGADYLNWYSPDEQTRLPVYRIPSAGLHELLAPGLTDSFNDIYCTLYDNFLITGTSYTTVTKVLYDNLLNRTLANDLSYRDFEATIPSRFSYSFYCVPARILPLLADLITPSGVRAVSGNMQSVRKISAMGLQLAPSNEMIYHSLSVRFAGEVREESASEWETLLDTTACIKPLFFTNHNTGAREIFVQDMKNNVYLINAAGRVLWKVPVRERINGPVFMIDYFRNGRLQLLFGGREYLHLLDRNGNYVDRFPVKMRSPAAGPLSVFDYDNNRDYRLFVAGEDRVIYAYDKSGSLVKGWTPYKTQGVVRSEIKFFRVAGKDYIVAGDETGIYFLDRRGSVRFTTREPVRKAVSSEIRLTSGTDPSLVCSSPVGEIQMISFNGSVRKIQTQKFSAGHAFDYFDVDGDGTGEFLFIDKGKLYLYDSKGSKLFTKEFNTNDLGGPIGFIFSGNDRGIGVIDNRARLIYIVNHKGEVFKGFPLKGASLFSIGKMSDAPGFNLIVGGTDNFLYNYRITR